MRRILASLVVAVTCGVSASTPALHAQGGVDRYLVVFKSDTLPADAAARVSAKGGTVTRSVPEIGVMAVAGDASFAKAMARDNAVLAVGGEHMFGLPPTTFVDVTADAPLAIGAPTAVDNLYSRQWDIRRIGAPAVWARGPVSANTPRVAVLDVGVMDTHPDLDGQIDNSISTSYCSTPGGANNTDGYPIYTTFIDLDIYPDWTPANGCTPLGFTDYEFHGSHVAGTVAAKFGGGRVVGVAPDAKVGAYKVFDIYQYQGTLNVGAFDTPIFNAIVDATNRGYRVISMSLGSSGLMRNDKSDNASWLAWNRVTQWANRHGVLVVAAAGNAALNSNGVQFSIPSDLPTVLSISAEGAGELALDSTGNYVVTPGTDVLAFYSNYGSAIDIAAPGGDCGPTYPNGCSSLYYVVSDGIGPTGAVAYYGAAGTSMATPHVSAVAAYVFAIHPDWTPGHVRAWLKQTAEPIGSRQLFGAGLLDADAAAK